MLKKIFGEAGVKNAVTLFHKPSLPASSRALDVLRKASDKDSKEPTITLEVTEQSPTSDQLRSILEFLGDGSASKVVEGASDTADAQRKLRLDASTLRRPLVVDWNAGKVVVGDSDAELSQITQAKTL